MLKYMNDMSHFVQLFLITGIMRQPIFKLSYCLIAQLFGTSQEVIIRRDYSNNKPVAAIEETGFDNVELYEGGYRAKDHFESGSCSAFRQSLGGNEAAIIVYFFDMLLDAIERIMKKIAFEFYRFYIVAIHKSFMRIIAFPPGNVTVKKSQFGIGVPAPMPDPLSAIIGEPVEGIKIILRTGFFDFQDTVAEFRRERFIGING